MHSDFKFEFNDNGQWRPVAFVDTVEDENNIELWYLDNDDATLHYAKASRGEGSGHFRDRA